MSVSFGKQSTLPVAVVVSAEPNTELPEATVVRVVDASRSAPPPELRLAITDIPKSSTKVRCTKLSLAFSIAGLFVVGALGYALYALLKKDPEPSAFLPGDVYGIEFVYSVNMREFPHVKETFEEAKRKWQRILVEPGVSPRPRSGLRLCDSPRVYNGTEVIDDLEIWVDILDIDGPDGVLGYAGPCGLMFKDTYRSITGEMVFDVADINLLYQDGSLKDVIIHEMGHVLGIGSSWGPEYSNLVVPDSYEYTGENGILGYESVGGPRYVSPPIELEGGDGTAFSHWDEGTFGNELMTGFVALGNNPLSKLTANSLVDLGYIVNISNADPYVLPAPIVSGRRLRSGHRQGYRHRMHGDSNAFHRKKKLRIERVYDFVENNSTTFDVGS